MSPIPVSRKAAVLPATGIGDALLMTIAAYHLSCAGYQVTLFHDRIHELAEWLPYCHFSPALQSEASLEPFDLVVAENDNSPQIKQWIQAFKEGRIKKLSLFYPTYLASKHGPLSVYDRTFFPNQPMAYNIGYAIRSLLQSLSPETTFEAHDLCDNAIIPSGALTHRAHPRRILLHPTSREPKKNWAPAHFEKLALQLKKRGYDPHFCISPTECPDWEPIALRTGCPLPHFPSLNHLAAYIYESGGLIGNDSFAGHLASNLQIPVITIANDYLRMQLWRPGWLTGELVLPPRWIPNPRILKWKETHWSYFVPVRAVLRAFDKKFI